MEEIFGEAKVQAQIDVITNDLNTLRDDKQKMDENPRIHVRYIQLNERKERRLTSKMNKRLLLLQKLQKEQDPTKREVLLKQI